MGSMTRLGLLGALSIEGGPDATAVLRQPKRAALLIYLACRPGTPVRRDTLLAMFWPETDDAHARDALNSALRFLRRQLGEATIQSLPGDAVAVDPASVETDVGQFVEAVTAGRYQEALSLYRGPLLDGFHTDGSGFEEWLDLERTRLHGQAVGVAHLLAERAAQHGVADTALATSLKWAALAPGDEQAALQVVAVLHAVGDRGGALAVWDSYVARLDREYGAEPSEAARAEADRVRHGGAPRFPLRTETASAHAPAAIAHAGPVAALPLLRAHRAVRRFWPAVAVVALLAAVGVAAVAPWLSRAPGPAIDQLTTTSPVAWPALSPDGMEVAYNRLECDGARQCISALVVAQADGSGDRVVARVATPLAPLFWTRDGQALVVRAYPSGQGIAEDPGNEWAVGTWLVPLAGGRPRRIGCCAAARGTASDTIATMQFGADVRIRFLTLPDGIARDSIRLPSGTPVTRFVVSPDLRFILMGRTIYDRQGQAVDRLPLHPPNCAIGPARWLADGRGILYQRCHPRLEGQAVLLRQAVTPAGGREGPPDTVLAALPLSMNFPSFDVSDDGSYLVYLNGRENVSHVLRRATTRDSLWQSRPLASAFYRVHGIPSPDGQRALIARVADADSMIWALSIMSIDSGPELPIGTLRHLQLGRIDWSPDSRALFAFVERTRDRALELVRIDAASGQRTNVAVLPAHAPWASEVHALAGGGFIIGVRDSSMSGFHRFMVPGLPDTTFALPPVQSDAGLLADSPDGREVAAFGQDAGRYYVDAVTVRTGARRRLVSGGVNPYLRPFWFTDGSLVFPTSGTWQVLTPEGRLERLGRAPFGVANYHISDDGLVAIANVSVSRGNLFIVRNFGELVPQ